MSWASKLVQREIRKRGFKGIMIWVLDLVAKAIPGKKYDEVVVEIKKIIKKVD
tara:strand:+ start:1413 stop:1571 length:159 start_codon:yes stop_codon:yes gene_type:complete